MSAAPDRGIPPFKPSGRAGGSAQWWATERKHLPLKDVAAVGGWTDTETLLNCYQQADPTTMLAVMSEPTKMRDLVAER